MLPGLDGKTAVVTGGGSGIGQSVCRRLAREGSRLLILDIDGEAAERTATDIRGDGGTAAAHFCDVASHAQVADVMAGLLAEGDVDILVNNAGIAHVGTVEQVSEADLDRLYGVNVKGVYNTLSALIPAMKARRQGVIVNVASVASSIGMPDRFAYAMTKGAVLTMTWSVARDYVAHGIRCNCVAPARVHTPFVDSYLADNYPDNRDEMFATLSKTQPIGRMGTPDEVAGLIAWLCSDEAAFVTGANFPIDGGFVSLKI